MSSFPYEQLIRYFPYEQLIILFTGVPAVWLSQDHRASWRKWACIFGLVGQPFWFYSFYKGSQWGMFIMAIFYTYSWVKGVYNNWIRKT